MTIPGLCLMPTWPAWVPGRRPWRLSCARLGCGSGPAAGTGSWTGTRSAGARTSRASCPARRRGSAPGSGPGTRLGPSSCPQMAEAMVVTPACAACGAPATRIELVGPGQLPAQWEHWPATVRDSFLRCRRARPVVPDPRRRGRRQRLRGSRRGPGRPGGSPGVPAVAALCPGGHGRVLRRCRLLPGLRRAVLLPALATCPRPGTGTAPAATARAWTRTGNGTGRRRLLRPPCLPGSDAHGQGLLRGAGRAAVRPADRPG